MNKICITHAWHQELTTDHIIWLNPILLYERLKHFHKAEVDIKPIDQINFEEYDKLIIFITGHIRDNFEEEILKHDLEVVFAIEDPNYDIKINDELIKKSLVFTPYRLLNKYKNTKTANEVLQSICETYDFNTPKDFIYLPTGVLPLYSAWYKNQLAKFDDLLYKEDLIRQNTKSNYVYCGSLKEERFKTFDQSDFNNGIDFYTNRLNKHKLYEITGLNTENVICHKKISPLTIPHAMQLVENCYFLIDDKMQLLDSIYLRYAEMAYANNYIIIKGPRYQTETEYLRLLEFGLENGRLSWNVLKKNWKPQLTILDRNIRKFILN